MAECDYCGRTFDGDAALLEHMHGEHEGELSRIDERRVADLEDDGGELPTGPIALAVIIFASAAVVAFVIFGGGGGNGSPGTASIPAPERTPTGNTHEHGTMEVVVLGDRVDFSQSKYQVSSTGNPNFHFENRNGRIWHAHAEGVTVQYALWTLGIGVPGPDTVIFDGTTYAESDGYNVSVRVNGEPVDPTTYALQGASVENPQQGDHVRIVVSQGNESG